MGIEPTTATLGKWSSTTELRPHLASNPAGETLEKPGETPRGRSAWEAGTLPLQTVSSLTRACLHPPSCSLRRHRGGLDAPQASKHRTNHRRQSPSLQAQRNEPNGDERPADQPLPSPNHHERQHQVRATQPRPNRYHDQAHPGSNAQPPNNQQHPVPDCPAPPSLRCQPGTADHRSAAAPRPPHPNRGRGRLHHYHSPNLVSAPLSVGGASDPSSQGIVVTTLFSVSIKFLPPCQRSPRERPPPQRVEVTVFQSPFPSRMGLGWRSSPRHRTSRLSSCGEDRASTAPTPRRNTFSTLPW